MVQLKNGELHWLPTPFQLPFGPHHYPAISKRHLTPRLARAAFDHRRLDDYSGRRHRSNHDRLLYPGVESVHVADFAKLHAGYSAGQHRTVIQDAGYGIRQIVDVARKALSPSSNDTTTAINCVDYLASILARLAARPSESPFRSEDGQLRVIGRGPTFSGLLAEAFDQTRQNAACNVAVLARLQRDDSGDPGGVRRTRRCTSTAKPRVVAALYRTVLRGRPLA